VQARPRAPHSPARSGDCLPGRVRIGRDLQFVGNLFSDTSKRNQDEIFSVEPEAFSLTVKGNLSFAVVFSMMLARLLLVLFLRKCEALWPVVVAHYLIDIIEFG
jgi:hypothetical protein